MVLHQGDYKITLIIFAVFLLLLYLFISTIFSLFQVRRIGKKDAAQNTHVRLQS